MPQQPINSKVNSLANAPTPQNTPASVTNSYLKSNPLTSLPKTINEDDESGLRQKLASNPAFISMIEGKLDSLVGTKSSYVASLPKAVKDRIFSLKAVQDDLQEVENQFQRELFELERKYLTKYAPIHEKRKKIINGDLEPTEEEVARGKEIEESLAGEDEEEEDAKIEEVKEEGEEEEKEEEEIKGIPDFWLTALENLSQVANIITERDQEVLSYLSNIRLEYLEKPGFKLIFEFSENPYFKNTELTKTYYYQEELGYSGDFIYDHAEGSTIEWNSTKRNVTISIERRKQRNKTTQQTRTIEKATPVESFFNFFDPPRADEQDERDEDEEDFDEATEELEQRLAFDYQLGEEIKDKLIPRAIDWFTGSAIEYEGDEFDDEEFDDEEDEEEDEEDDEEDDEDEDEDEDDDIEGGEKKQPAECKQS